MSATEFADVWADDLLGFRARGNAFTALVQSIDDHRTISIEAGYGHGKTFFRERWAKQLELEGECVVQIDARLSDHSGDPVVTFLAALLSLVPEKETARFEKAAVITKKVAVGGAKVAVKAILREGAKEAFEAFESEDHDVDALHEVAKAAGASLSKAAGELIAAQLTAEKARVEVGEQLKALQDQIAEGTEQERIIILVDELDRCHPEYAITFIEAMKLVFDQDGFVFVLMVNKGYMEKIAQHRFGTAIEGESYIDKFVDLRLKLEPGGDSLVSAARAIFSQLPIGQPLGDVPEFSLERTIELAVRLAPSSELSIRQIKRVFERVELALRLYRNVPIDAPLLVYLAFRDASSSASTYPDAAVLPRAQLTPSAGEAKQKANPKSESVSQQREWSASEDYNVEKDFPELTNLAPDVYGSPKDDKNYYLWVKIYKHFAVHYIPSHQAMLDAVRTLQADA